MTDTPEDPKEPSAPPQDPPAPIASDERQTAEPVSAPEEHAAEAHAEEDLPAEAPVEEPPAPPPPPPEPVRAQSPPLPPPRIERPAPPPPQAPPPVAKGLPWIPILAVVGILVILLAGAFAWRAVSGEGAQEETYAVQPFTPTTELITGRDRVEARAEPDAASRIVVIFGQGVTLNVFGRVQRGLGNDWYQISWNGQNAFVRTQDVVAGSGAPPAPIVRVREEDEEEDKEDEKPDEQLPNEEEPRVTAAPSGALGVGDVNWVREPSARDFARYFPDEALDEGQSGNVTLSCIIGGSGRLACSVASESPSGYGFGNAAIGISRQLRVRTTLPDGSSAEGREMRLPLSFRAN